MLSPRPTFLIQRFPQGSFNMEIARLFIPFLQTSIYTGHLPWTTEYTRNRVGLYYTLGMTRDLTFMEIRELGMTSAFF